MLIKAEYIEPGNIIPQCVNICTLSIVKHDDCNGKAWYSVLMLVCFNILIFRYFLSYFCCMLFHLYIGNIISCFDAMLVFWLVLKRK